MDQDLALQRTPLVVSEELSVLLEHGEQVELKHHWQVEEYTQKSADPVSSKTSNDWLFFPIWIATEYPTLDLIQSIQLSWTSPSSR
jgi:hypothetical protein